MIERRNQGVHGREVDRSNSRRGRGRLGRAVIGCIAAGWIAVASPAWSAGKGIHEVVWAHSNASSVSRFVLFISAVKGDRASARQVDVGKPDSEPSGSFQMFSAIVAMNSSEFVAVAAVGTNGQMGALSSWGGVQPSRPGQPIVIEP